MVMMTIVTKPEMNHNVVVMMITMTTTMTTIGATVRDLGLPLPVKDRRGIADLRRRKEPTRGDPRQSAESEGNTRRCHRWYHRLFIGKSREEGRVFEDEQFVSKLM